MYQKWIFFFANMTCSLSALALVCPDVFENNKNNFTLSYERRCSNSKWKGLFLHRAVHRQHEPAQFRRGAVFLRCAFTLKLTLFYCQLKRESNGNTVTIRPGGLSFRLSEPIESHKCDHPDERPITPRWLTRTISDSRPLLNRWTTSDANLMLSTPA